MTPTEDKFFDLSTIKNKKAVARLENNLRRIADLKEQVKAITNREKGGELDRLQAETEDLMKLLGIDKSVVVDGWSHKIVPGASVTISQPNLKKAMMHYGIDPDIQQAILMEATQRTEYTALQSQRVKKNGTAD